MSRNTGAISLTFGGSLKPLNPKTKQQMHTLWRTNPKENSIEALARRFGIRQERVQAILKLKEREEEIAKTKPELHNKKIETLLWSTVRDTGAPISRKTRGPTTEVEEARAQLIDARFMTTAETESAEQVISLLRNVSPAATKVREPVKTGLTEPTYQVVEPAGAQPNARWRFQFEATKGDVPFAIREKDGSLVKVSDAEPPQRRITRKVA